MVDYKDMDLDSGRSDIDIDILKQELEEEREAYKRQPWYYKFYQFWC